MIAKNHTFVETMKDIGKEWSLSDETFKGTEEFVCNLYEKCTSVDSLRNEHHCAKDGKIEAEALPPYQSSLRLHVSRTTRQLSGGEPQRRILTSLRLTDIGGAGIRPIWNLRG